MHYKLILSVFILPKKITVGGNRNLDSKELKIKVKIQVVLVDMHVITAVKKSWNTRQVVYENVTLANTVTSNILGTEFHRLYIRVVNLQSGSGVIGIKHEGTQRVDGRLFLTLCLFYNTLKHIHAYVWIKFLFSL